MGSRVVTWFGAFDFEGPSPRGVCDVIGCHEQLYNVWGLGVFWGAGLGGVEFRV